MHGIVPGILLILVGYTKNIEIIVIYMTISFGCLGFAPSGYQCCFLDISPTRSNILIGIANTFSTVGGITAPILCGFLQTKYNNSFFGWKIIFFINATIFIFGALIMKIFVKSK